MPSSAGARSMESFVCGEACEEKTPQHGWSAVWASARLPALTSTTPKTQSQTETRNPLIMFALEDLPGRSFSNSSTDLATRQQGHHVSSVGQKALLYGIPLGCGCDTD